MFHLTVLNTPPGRALSLIFSRSVCARPRADDLTFSCTNDVAVGVLKISGSMMSSANCESASARLARPAAVDDTFWLVRCVSKPGLSRANDWMPLVRRSDRRCPVLLHVHPGV